MYAVRPNDGTVAWKFSGAPGTFGVRGTPALSTDATTVYFGSGGGVLYSLNLAGQLQWQASITGPSGGFIENAPAVGSDGTIYVATGGSSGNTPGDIDAFTPAGTLKWHFTANGTFETTPAVTPDGLIVAGDDAGSIVTVHAADGTPAWSFAAPGTYGTNGFSDSSPAIGADGTVYAQNGTIFAIKNGAIIWSAPGTSDASPALDPSSGTLYVAGGGGLKAYPGPAKVRNTCRPSRNSLASASRNSFVRHKCRTRWGLLRVEFGGG
jgi:outer membrane protein assembly factor BamB